MLHSITNEGRHAAADRATKSAHSHNVLSGPGVRNVADFDGGATAGNQALLRMRANGAAAMARPSQTILQRQCNCGGAGPQSADKERPFLQAKLEVGAVDDPLEREADSVADDVMRASNNGPVASVAHSVQRKISRQEAAGLIAYDSALAPEEEEKEQPQAEVQRSATGESTSVPQHFEHALDGRIAAGGEKLPPQIGAFMGDRFGREFEGVQIHRDVAAGELARSVSARAFTVGNNIFFAQNAYRPESPAGQHLIAHELTHVVQQNASSGTVARKVQRVPAPSCASYPGYDTSVPITTYNCAGLALRTYAFTAPSSAAVTALTSLHPLGKSVDCAGKCRAGEIKYWLWDYDLETADATGTPVPGSKHPDFHIVAGMTDAKGADPTNVYSKNGHRPVHGTGTGPSFRPPAFAQYLSNDAAESPVAGTYVNRSNFVDSCFCTNC